MLAQGVVGLACFQMHFLPFQNQSENNWNEEEMSQCMLSYLHFPYKCPGVMTLGKAPPMGGSSIYLQGTNTIFHLSNPVKAY